MTPLQRAVIHQAIEEIAASIEKLIQQQRELQELLNQDAKKAA